MLPEGWGKSSSDLKEPLIPTAIMQPLLSRQESSYQTARLVQDIVLQHGLPRNALPHSTDEDLVKEPFVGDASPSANWLQGIQSSGNGRLVDVLYLLLVTSWHRV